MTRKIQLLIIEDEVAIREGLIDVFVYHGYDVTRPKMAMTD
jgi:DNA-binding response OmpR family regulator